MSTQVQYRRGTAAENDAFTGALAEMTIDTTNGTIRVHNGVTAGGSNIATVAYVAAQIGSLSANSISSGTSNVRVVSSGGNVATSVGGTSNVMVVSSTDVTITGNLTVTGNATLSGNILGDRIQNGTTTIDIQSTGGNANITVGGTSNVAVFATTGAFITGVTSVSGNVTGGNVLTAGLISATGAVTAASVVGGIMTGSSLSVTGTINGTTLTGTGLTVSTGNITGGNLILSGAIEDSGQLDIRTTASNSNIVLTPNGTGNVNIGSNVMPTANATANIGSATLSFNTIFARATSAQYADLAEMYVADTNYPPGTVVEFGGQYEITATTQSHSTQVAGIISTAPGYLMNSTQAGNNVLPVALTGRVPCLVIGHIAKGDRLVASDLPGVARSLDPDQYGPACIIGKSLENYNSDQVGTIEVAVGRT
jgi:hypothetical protein